MGGKASLKVNDNPGPGTYDLTSNQNQGSQSTKAISFGNQERDTTQGFHNKNSKSTIQEPGPGAYDTQDGLTSARNMASGGGKFGQSKREGAGNPNPGPGTYDFNQKQGGGFTIKGRP